MTQLEQKNSCLEFARQLFKNNSKEWKVYAQSLSKQEVKNNSGVKPYIEIIILPGNKRHCDRKCPEVASSEQVLGCRLLLFAEEAVVDADAGRQQQHEAEHKVVLPRKVVGDRHFASFSAAASLPKSAANKNREGSINLMFANWHSFAYAWISSQLNLRLWPLLFFAVTWISIFF